MGVLFCVSAGGAARRVEGELLSDADRALVCENVRAEDLQLEPYSWVAYTDRNQPRQHFNYGNKRLQCCALACIMFACVRMRMCL